MQEQSIFIEALEREDPAERAAFLDRACAGDAALRQRVERLLQRHQQADSFLDRPTATLARGVAAARIFFSSEFRAHFGGKRRTER